MGAFHDGQAGPGARLGGAGDAGGGRGGGGADCLRLVNEGQVLPLQGASALVRQYPINLKSYTFSSAGIEKHQHLGSRANESRRCTA